MGSNQMHFDNEAAGLCLHHNWRPKIMTAGLKIRKSYNKINDDSGRKFLQVFRWLGQKIRSIKLSNIKK